jgi:NAD(P)-dependent dehydrogenase (short-subunit alcohol dehydrogenase family)
MKVAMVTGGARGIGLGISTCLARDGFSLAVCGTRPERDVSAALSALKADVAYQQADVGERADREAWIEAVRRRFGRVDLLVNNAGVAPRARVDLVDATEEEFDRVFRINARGPYFLTQRVARWMIEQKHGCIVNISSISAEVASVNRGEYCVSKAALSMATKLWAARLAAHGIPVYEVRPGVIKTDMTAAVQEKYDRLLKEGLALEPRWGTPEDVGRAVAMLARGDLPYATGQVLMVDGGLTVQRL